MNAIETTTGGNKHFGEALIALRERKNLSREYVANTISCSVEALRAAEMGNLPAHELLVRLAKLYEADEDRLWRLGIAQTPEQQRGIKSWILSPERFKKHPSETPAVKSFPLSTGSNDAKNGKRPAPDVTPGLPVQPPNAPDPSTCSDVLAKIAWHLYEAHRLGRELASLGDQAAIRSAGESLGFLLEEIAKERPA